MPVQALLLRVGSSGARAFPHWYHRQVCRLLGIRIHIDGAVVRDRPVLLVANHTTWLDIPVLSAVAPVSFVAKKEVGTWPFVSSLARLQRSVFVDRTRRTAVGQAAGEILARLAQGDTVVLFAEGTSSDGNRVLPFMTSLFAAAKPSGGGHRRAGRRRADAFRRLHAAARHPAWARGAPRQSHGTATWRCAGMPGRCSRPGRSMSRSASGRRCRWRVSPTARSWRGIAKHKCASTSCASCARRRRRTRITIAAPQDAPSAVRTRVAAEPGQKWT